MAFQHQHKRSSEKNRRPRPADLIDGQIAVNYNPDTPGLYFKDSNGGLAKAGSVHVGSKPVPSNYAEFSLGELVFDTDTGEFSIWTGEGWTSIANSAFAEGTGPQGKSAYQTALDNGFVGNEQEWLNSLSTNETIVGIQEDITQILSSLGIGSGATTFGEFTSPMFDDHQNLKYVLEELGIRIEARRNTVDTELSLRLPTSNANMLGTPTAPTAAPDTNTTQIATTEFVSSAVAALIDSAPGTLDTLAELAEAINDDDAVFTSLTNSIAAVQADVDQNEADADAAIVAVQADVDQNEADADAAIAAVQADVDQNEADADSAISGLDTRIAAFELDPGPPGAVFSETDANADDLITLSGVAENSTNLGTFTGSTITDNATIKAALQTLETTLEAVDIDTDDLAALTGLAENVTNLGTFTGSTISDSVAVKVALQELETAQEATQADVDQNESDSDAANNAIFGRLVTLEADPTTGTAVAAVQADVDQNESDADTAIALKANIDDPTFTTKIASPEFHSDGGHLKFKTATNDILFYPNDTETLQITRSGTDCRFTSNGGTGTFKFFQETDFGDGIKLGGVAVTADAAELNFVDGVTSNVQTQLDAIQADVDQNESDADAAIALKADIASPTFTGTPAAPTASSGANTTQIATTAFVTTAVANLIDGAPGAIDTLNELAAALGDDADFSTTITNSIAAVQTDVDANELAADNAIAELNTDVTDIVTAIGVAENAQNLGTFTGTTISDNTTVKAALQEVETALEGHIPVLVEVHNQTGGALTKGDVVYVSGTHSSGKPTVALADANGSGTYPALGLIYATVADGVDGLVIISGFLDGIDTDTPAWDAGDALYVSETAGEMTTTRPTASGTKVQKVAMTARRHASSGSVIVIGAGRTNDVPNELTALTGVALNAANLGTFTGATISDNTTVKTALQELEAAHESLPRMLHASWDASTAGSFDDANDVIASRGIASVVRSAEGIFRVTFTTAFANSNYTVTCGVGSTDYSGTGASPREVSILERNAAYVDVICERSDDAVNEDNAYMSLMVML